MEVALDPNLKEGVLGKHATLWDKQKRGYHASLQNDEMISCDDDLVEYKDLIKIKKTSYGYNPWDDEHATRCGQNWKRYRKHQWK